MRLYSIPYYIDFVGQPIPGTNRKTQNLHALLFGLIQSLDNSDSGCYASKETLADRLHTTPAKIKNLRSDLIKLNWVSVVKNKMGEITNTYAAETKLIPVGNPQVASQQPTGCRGSNPQVAWSTEVRPQSEYNNINKKREPISDEIGSPQPAAGSSRKEVQSSLPFDDPVKDVTPTSLRPDKLKGDADRARRHEFAIVGELRKHFGFTKGTANEAERKLVHQRLEDGWSKEEMIKVIAWLRENKDWYKDKPLQTCLRKEAFDEYQAVNGTGNSSDFFAGMSDEEIHYWKMTHDEEYYEEFMRKAKEAGNL